MLFKNDKVGFIILNVLRAMNILSLFAAMVASGFLVFKTANLTGEIGWYNVFDLAEKVFIILFCLFLIVTELPKAFDGYLDRNWPIFGHFAGFYMLSLFLMFIGCDVLSYLTKAETDEKHLGEHFFRTVQAGGFMCLVMSIINVPASILFRTKGLSARQSRSSRREAYPIGMEMGSV